MFLDYIYSMLPRKEDGMSGVRQEDDVSDPDYGVLPRQDGVVSGLWRTASPGGWCVRIMACCLAKMALCLDYGALFR